MPNKSSFKFKKDLGKEQLKKAKAQIRTYAIANFQRKLQKVVDPFVTDIQIHTTTKTERDTFTVTVQARRGIITTNRVGAPVESAQIFQWLNEGTSVRKVGLPIDFSNETKPNSLTTTSANYDRNSIYQLPKGKSFTGIEARNWTKRLNEVNAPATRRLFEKIGDIIVSRTQAG